MKSALIFLLMIGLGISLYFNYKAHSAGEIPGIAKKNMRLFFYVKGSGNTMQAMSQKPGMGNDTTLLSSVKISESSTDKAGTMLLSGVCCPIPPRDTSAIRMSNPCIDLEKLVKVEIKPSDE